MIYFQHLIDIAKGKLDNPMTLDKKNNLYKNIGFYYYQLKNKEEAIIWFLKVDPLDFSSCRSLAAIYTDIDMTKSILYTEKCLGFEFNIDIAYDLACNYTKLCIFHKAYGLFETIISLDPTYINAYNNQADILNCILQQKRALEYYEKGYELDKTRLDIFSNLVMTTYYINRFSNNKRLFYTNKYNNLMNIPEDKINKHNTIIDKKNINIGYLGFDFDKINHPISCFMKHIFSNHTFNVFCYQVSSKIVHHFQSKNNDQLYTIEMDNVTTRNLSDCNNEQAVNIIKGDNIDILIELMHHTAGNRLKILAYKPAPIQISYCAFPGTTGLNTIDYKIIDNNTFTLSAKDNNSEELLCMKNGYHCYVPTYRFPPLKFIKHDNINLCCFNNVKKINDDVIELWIHILRLLNNSILYLRYFHYSSSYVITCLKKRFMDISSKLEYKLDINRIKFIGTKKNYVDVLKIYNNMDIFLDTFPYTGTTVICEALKMGIPVITLLGTQIHERVCASLLKSLGKPDLVANNKQEYINKVINIAKSPNLLNMLKHQLPNLMNTTILGNPKIFIKQYEDILITSIDKYNKKIEM